MHVESLDMCQTYWHWKWKIMPMHVNGTTDVQIGSDQCILVLRTSKALHKGSSDD